MPAPGEGTPLPGERPLVTNPNEYYVATLCREKTKPDMFEPYAQAVEAAFLDLMLEPGDPKRLELPSMQTLAIRLPMEKPAHLADIQLAAAHLDGRRALLNRMLRGVGRAAINTLPPVQVARRQSYRNLSEAAKEIVTKDYGISWNGYNVAPFLWGSVIYRVAKTAKPVSEKVWHRLAVRFAASYDGAIRPEMAPAVPHRLRAFRLDLPKRNITESAALWAVQNFVFPPEVEDAL